MEKAYFPLKSVQLDEEEDGAISEVPQSPGAESLSDVHSPLLLNKKVFLDPSPGDASVWRTVANLVNLIEGVCFLALPCALKEGGIGALVGFVIIPIILWYMGSILIECLYDEDKEGKKSRARSGYEDLGQVLLPKYGGYILSFFVQIDLFLVSVSYLDLFGSVMHHALPFVPITELMWISIAGGLALPTTFLNSLSQIAWLSVISVLALAGVVVAVIWHGAENGNEWNLDNVLFWNSEGTIRSLSVIMYSYMAYLIFPSVEGGMAEKAKFSRALAWAYLISALTKLLFSLFAFLYFGADTDEVILNNLPPGPVHIIVSCLVAFSCVLSHVLILFPVLEFIHNAVTTHMKNDKIPGILTYTVVRVTLVLLSVVFAILLPSFYVIVMFLGSSMGCFIGYILPCLLHLKLRYKQLSLYQVVLDITLLCFGVVVIVLGVTTSIRAFFD